MRTGVQLTGVAVVVLLALPGQIHAAAASPPSPNAALRGDYDVTLVRTCATQATETFSGSTTLTSTATAPQMMRGVAFYDGNGGGTFTGQALTMGGLGAAGTGISLGIPPGGANPVEVFVGRADLSPCTLSYTVNPDGTFTQQFNCTTTPLVGSLAGTQTATQLIQFEGRLTLDGTVLVISKTSLDLESTTLLIGPFVGQSFNRLCNTHGTATSRR